MKDTIKQIQFQSATEVYISDSGNLCIAQENFVHGEIITHIIAKNNIKDFIKLCTVISKNSEVQNATS